MSIIKYLFEEVFDKNIDLYNKHIDMIKIEYKIIMDILKVSNSIAEIMFNVHKLVGLLANLMVCTTGELMYQCKLLLLLDKYDTSIPVESYQHCIEFILNFQKSKIGL
jgi:hypothetical protein